MSGCQNPDEERRGESGWRRCCATMATLCSRYCDGCTVCGASYRLIVFGALVLFAAGGYVVSATATAAYAGLDAQQRIDRPKEHLQLLQAATCTIGALAAAHDGRLVVVVYLAFVVAVLHVSQAAIVMEATRYGDCVRCYQTAEHCECQRLKEPVSPGSLDNAAAIVTRSIRRSRRPRHLDSA